MDAEIGKNENVILYNIKDIEKRINFNKEARNKEMEIAERIIKEEIKKNHG